MCYPCYKSHTVLLKQTKPASTDDELESIICVTNQKISQIQVHTSDDAVHRAMLSTTAFVAENLLNYQVLLLPSVHDFFTQQVRGIMQAFNLEGVENVHQLVTSQWILSNLIATLEHHMTCVCKVRKHGTLIFRQNTDCLSLLSQALWKLRNTCIKQPETHKPPSAHLPAETSMDQVLDDLNSHIHECIRRLVAQECVTPFQHDAVEIDHLIEQIDPKLWNAVSMLTRSVSERRGKSASKNTASPVSHVKKIRQLFALCTLLFCTDDRCSVPLHTLIADIVDSLGGSSLLLRILNRLGVCASSDTLSRFIQHNVQSKRTGETEPDLDQQEFTVVSADNIDFLHSYARVFSGKQNSSWHGTTVQAVQPKVSEAEQVGSQAFQLHRLAGENTTQTEVLSTPVMISDDETATRHDSHPAPATPEIALHMSIRHKRNSGETSPPTKRTRLSVPKVQRRARTGTEQGSTQARTSSSQLKYNVDKSHTNQADSHEMLAQKTLSDFEVSGEESAALTQLQEDINIFLLQKHVTSSDTQENLSFISIQAFLSTCRNSSAQRSKVAYLRVMDAVADSKDTVLQLTHDLYQQFIFDQKMKWLVVEGDAKVYEVLKALKNEYGEELRWMLPYPGDWHILKNYQIAIMQAYFDAGLKELAQAAGYPVASIQSCSKFKRTHCFIVEVWEALYRVMIAKYFEHCNASSSAQENLKYLISESVSQVQSSNDFSRDLNKALTNLKSRMGTQFDDFRDFLTTLASRDSTWKFWVQFVFEDAMAYLGLYLAIRSGNWNLRMASMKLMAPLFTAFDHPNYLRLITDHIADVLTMPATILSILQKGGFAVSICGRPWHSVGIDEAHEMLINRSCKNAIVRPTADYINRIAQYIPYRYEH